MEYRIGQFSLITRLSVKTLRYYHEIDLLTPSRTDPDSGYRYYDEELVEKARLVSLLRDLDVPLAEIPPIVRRVESGESVDELIGVHAERVESRIERLEQVRADIHRFLARHAAAAVNGAAPAEDGRQLGGDSPRTGGCDLRSVAPELVVSVRFTGRYEESGDVLVAIAREIGPSIAGVPFSLYWNEEHLPDAADIEACFPVRHVIEDRRVDRWTMSSRVVPAARCLVTVHRGPYQGIGDAYARVFRRMEELSFGLALPIRERYLRGPAPGLDPKDYLTEVAVELVG